VNVAGSPDHSADRTARPSSSFSARTRSSASSPNDVNSASAGVPSPTPRIAPAAAQDVERDGLMRQLPWSPPRHRGDHRSEPHALGPRRDRAEHDPRIDDRHGERRREPDVIPQEEAVPAVSVRLDAERDQTARVADVRNADAEPHAVTLRPLDVERTFD
jgi:hypothetical protein